jgi:hypothetical protein
VIPESGGGHVLSPGGEDTGEGERSTDFGAASEDEDEDEDERMKMIRC